MARCISVLLSVVLLICPTLCAVGRCCDAPQSDAKQRGADRSCCHKGAGTCEEGSRPAEGPRPNSDSNAGGGQCICHGAVVDLASWQGVELDVRWDLPAVIVPVVAGTSASPLSITHEMRQPDIGKSSGRAVCILLSTMQC